MNRIYYYMTLFILAGAWSAAAPATDATPAAAGPVLNENQIQAMEQRLATVTDPAARLFFQANIYRAKGEQEKALQTLAQLNVLHAYDKRWITRSELLSAKLYMEVGMPDQADVTARQVEFLNEGTEAAETARLFREKIKQVKEKSEVSE
jgi:cytochrome c-type biogenesis protein CcmH/NrfG